MKKAVSFLRGEMIESFHFVNSFVFLSVYLTGGHMTIKSQVAVVIRSFFGLIAS